MRAKQNGTKPVDVVEVMPLGGYRVALVFSDGHRAERDLGPYLVGPVFEPVRDPDYFRRVRVDAQSGTIVWPNGADLAPDSLRMQPAPRD
ncbi:MAG TPA: DUF2442 domain-containing protein [Actinomycetota bacterium]|nr:DUF2442 domain-containing protein [Actinomycetota bacterium]